jgi:hypothetical protein
MIKTITFLFIWVAFVSYGFFFSPPDDPNTLDLIVNLSSGQWEGINPYIICLFNIMGILPFIYASFLIIDGRGQKLMATPFVIGSFFLGAFALLPYFAFRQPVDEFTGEKTKIINVLDSRFFAILTTIGCVVLIGIAITKGDWQDFVIQWQNSKFINVMSLDFCCLSLLFPTIIYDDIQKRNIANPEIFRILSFIPLFGALIYICSRPSLNVETENPVSLKSQVS